jgi:hypothetical protein
MAKATCTFNKKQTLFANKLDLSSGKNLVKYCKWDIVLYGAVTLTLRQVAQK